MKKLAETAVVISYSVGELLMSQVLRFWWQWQGRVCLTGCDTV